MILTVITKLWHRKKAHLFDLIPPTISDAILGIEHGPLVRGQNIKHEVNDLLFSNDYQYQRILDKLNNCSTRTVSCPRNEEWGANLTSYELLKSR